MSLYSDYWLKYLDSLPEEIVDDRDKMVAYLYIEGFAGHEVMAQKILKMSSDTWVAYLLNHLYIKDETR